jgi:hypothetical protein
LKLIRSNDHKASITVISITRIMNLKSYFNVIFNETLLYLRFFKQRFHYTFSLISSIPFTIKIVLQKLNLSSFKPQIMMMLMQKIFVTFMEIIVLILPLNIITEITYKKHDSHNCKIEI